MNKKNLIINLLSFASTGTILSHAKEQCITCICKDDNDKIVDLGSSSSQCNTGPNKTRNRTLCAEDANKLCASRCAAQNKVLHKCYIWQHNPVAHCAQEFIDKLKE